MKGTLIKSRVEFLEKPMVYRSVLIHGYFRCPLRSITLISTNDVMLGIRALTTLNAFVLHIRGTILKIPLDFHSVFVTHHYQSMNQVSQLCSSPSISFRVTIIVRAITQWNYGLNLGYLTSTNVCGQRSLFTA